jgi:capsular polysaccharide biosynthesis protein
MKEATKLVRREEDAREVERRADEPSSYRGAYGYGAESVENEVHLLDYWRAIRKRLWLVLGVAALLTTLSMIYVARKPDIYEAGSRVQVDLESNPMYGSGQAPMILNPVSDPAYFNTQLQILTSPGLLRRVVKTLDLEHNKAFLRPQTSQSHSTWKTITQMLGIGGGDQKTSAQPPNVLPLTPSIAPATSSEDLVEAKRLAPYVGALMGGLRVEPVRENRAGYYKETRLIDIDYQHGDPEIAAKVVNAVAETFVRSNLEKKSETNTSTSEFLSKRVTELQTQIRTAEERLVDYAKKNPGKLTNASSASGYLNIYMADLDGKNLQRVSTSRKIEVEPKPNPIPQGHANANIPVVAWQYYGDYPKKRVPGKKDPVGGDIDFDMLNPAYESLVLSGLVLPPSGPP